MESLPQSVTATAEGLPAPSISNRHARARIFLQGAHAAAWRPVGEEEVLWTSLLSHFVEGEAIRGGAPICCPWFDPHATRADLPAHGFARTRPFSLARAEELSDGRTR